MSHDILDSSKQNKIQTKEKRRTERDDSDIRKLLTMVEFRRFLWRVWTYCGIYKSSFTGNSTTFFQEGVRSVGLWLLNIVMRAKPEAFAQIQQEYYSERRSEEAQKDLQNKEDEKDV